MKRARLLAIGVMAAAGCSRTHLLAGAAGDRSGGGGGTSTSSGGGTGGAGGEPITPCVVALAGLPTEVLAFVEGDLGAPALVALPGAAEGAGARVALHAISEDANFWHPELRVAELAIGGGWPDVSLAHAPVLWGVDAHALGAATPEAGGGPGLALAWFYGAEAIPQNPGGVKFRRFDTASWTPGPDVFVDKAGETVFALAAGAGSDGVSWSGAGYAVAYRGTSADPAVVEARVAVLDQGGGVTAGPFALTGPMPYPGRSADAAWTGTTYLGAVSFDECPAADALCTPRSVVVARLRPDGGAPELAAPIPGLDGGDAPPRPAIPARGGSVWLAWSEGPAEDDAAPRTIRVLALAPDGTPLGAPIVVNASGVVLTRVHLAVTPLGVFVIYGQPADGTLGEGQLGHRQLVVAQYAADGAPVQPLLSIPSTAFALSSSPTAVAIAPGSKRALAVAWAAAPAPPPPQPPGASVAYLARLDCP